MEAIHQRYRGRAHFLLIYVREAHPAPGRTFRGSGVRPRRHQGNGAVSQPRSLRERSAVARLCAERLGLTMPVVVDDMEDRVSRLYRAWPDRLYLLDAEGRVVYAGARGPGGFDPTQLERALLRELGSESPEGAAADGVEDRAR